MCFFFLLQKLGKKETDGHWPQSGLVSDHNIIITIDYVYPSQDQEYALTGSLHVVKAVRS